MRNFVLVSMVLLAGLAARAQSAPPIGTMSKMGVSYGPPAGWMPIETQRSAPGASAEPTQKPGTQEEKKGTACIETPLTAIHGNPLSEIVVVTLPFDCYGQTMTGQDLAGFGSGAAEGLKQEFDVLEPVYGAYALGSHRFWIERARASAKGESKTQETLEIACSVLKKGAVCWMAVAADEASLRDFESSPVSLEGEAPAALVPADAFEKTP